MRAARDSSRAGARGLTKILIALLLVVGSTVEAHMGGVVGEAFVVPYVEHGTRDSDGKRVTTVLLVTTPRFVGVDTIPALFTAPHTTNPAVNRRSERADLNTTHEGYYLHPGANSRSPGDGRGEDWLWWFFYDETGRRRAAGALSLAPNEITMIDLSRTGVPRGVPGYMLIVDASALDGRAANLVMAVQAWIEVEGDRRRLPAYAMSDGEDRPDDDEPRIGNEVVYGADGLEFYPLVTGPSPTHWRPDVDGFPFFQLFGRESALPPGHP